MVLLVGCSHCCLAADEIQQQAPAKPVDDADQLDLDDIMQMCNESFRTSMGLYSLLDGERTNLWHFAVFYFFSSHTEYLTELNETGTFPDENDKTPMVSIFEL